MGAAQASKFSQESEYEIEEDEEYYVTRPHSSVRRYNQPVQRDTLDDVDISKGHLFIKGALMPILIQTAASCHMMGPHHGGKVGVMISAFL